MHNDYLTIILEDKIYTQRTSTSKFTEFTLNGIKLNTYDELPKEIKQIADEMILSETSPETFFEYQKIDNEIVITKINNLNATHIKIPEYINGLPVTTLDTSIIPEGSKIKQIQLPETIENFADACFANAIQLRFVNIPHKIIKIPNHCFHNCYTISGIDFSNIKEIGKYAFTSCYGLKRIDLSSVEKINEHAFHNCPFLKNVILSENLKTLENGTFKSCLELNNIKLPNKIEILEDSVFEDCFQLKNISFPDSLRSIGNYCFCRCREINSFTAPRNLEDIGRYAFGLTDLETINLNFNIKNIYESTFSDCKNLKNIILTNMSSNVIELLGIDYIDKIKIITNDGQYIDVRNYKERGVEK